MSSNEQRRKTQNQGVHTSSTGLKNPPSNIPINPHHPIQSDHHRDQQINPSSFYVQTNEQKVSSVPDMNTNIGVNTCQHAGVNSIANIGDNSRFDHGVNTMSKIGVNTNSRSGENTRKISSYKAHQAKRTYTKKKDRIGVNTSFSSDNRYTTVGTRNVKSWICLLLMHNPSAKRMY